MLLTWQRLCSNSCNLISVFPATFSVSSHSPYSPGCSQQYWVTVAFLSNCWATYKFTEHVKEENLQFLSILLSINLFIDIHQEDFERNPVPATFHSTSSEFFNGFRGCQSVVFIVWVLLGRENSRHLATLPLVSPPNDVWEKSAVIPYWWLVTSQIWVVLLIGRAAWEIWLNQSEALPRSGQWRVISMEFLRSFLRRLLAGKPVVAPPNVGCFLRLGCCFRIKK